MLSVPCDAWRQAVDRNATRFKLTQLAVVLEGYRIAHGRFPRKLSELSPRFFKRIPTDPFSGKPLVYKPQPKGYLLYAVGENGKDDGGRTFDSQPPADDVAVRIRRRIDAASERNGNRK